MLKLAFQSLANRRVTLGLTVLAIAISVALILGIERLRNAARDGFANTVSGVDLIVASRGNDVQILLATAYGVGYTTNSLSWETYETLEAIPEVDWAVPLAMGDTYGDFPIIGTSHDYFEHFSYGRGQLLEIADGSTFQGAESAVLGSEVARTLGLEVGGNFVAAHGSGPILTTEHDEHPFTISGILAPTGTPVDRMIYVPLDGFALLHEVEAGPADMALDQLGAVTAQEPTDHNHDEVHEDDHAEGHDHDEGHADDHAESHNHDEAHVGEKNHEEAPGHEHDHEHAITPDQINAVFVGLASKSQTLGIQRWIAQYEDEPLTAVLPGAALLQLWSITGVAERTLRIVAMAVVVAGLLGMLTMITATLEARRREFAILRAVGATPRRIGALILIEAALITVSGLLIGCAVLYVAQALAAPILSERVGIDLSPGWPSGPELWLLGLVFVIGLAASLLPALRVYRMTVSDGLNVKL